MSLEDKLKMSAEPWLAGEEMDQVRAARLEALVRRRGWGRRRRWISAAAVAAAIVYGVFFSSSLVALAARMPIVGEYIARMAQRDPGVKWADQTGLVLPVNQSVTDQGYTLRVDSIVADASRTLIYVVIEGPDLNPSFMQGMPYSVVFNTKSLVTRADSAQWEFRDGRFVGVIETVPMPTPVSALSVRFNEINGKNGKWHVSFTASRAAPDEQSRTLELNQRVTGDGYDFTVRRVVLAPTGTKVEGTLPGGPGFQSAELWADGQQIPAEVGLSIPVAPLPTQYGFNRVDPGAAELVFRLSTNPLDRTRFTLPLKPGAAVSTPGLTVEFAGMEIQNGKPRISLKWSGPAAYQFWSEHGILIMDSVENVGYKALTEAIPQPDGSLLVAVRSPFPMTKPGQLMTMTPPIKSDSEVAVRIPLK